MFSVRTVVLVLALVPATLAAQRGGRGGGRSMGGGQGSQGRSGGAAELKLSNGDVEDMSSIKLLIDKRKDLKLSDAQVKQLKDLESEMKTRNEVLFHRLDSLRKDLSSPDGRAHMIDDRQAVMEVVADIRLSYSETLKRAMPLLDDSQKAKAEALVQTLNDTADKTLQEKVIGSGNRTSSTLESRRSPADDRASYSATVP